MVISQSMRIGMLGSKFMGRAHSNAYINAPKFFDLKRKIVLQNVCARNEASLKAFAQNWGWLNWTSDWRKLVTDAEVDLVDIGSPNHLHFEPAVAALEAGKHVVCEKPLANDLSEAREMVKIAKKHRKLKSYVWFNYRRCPAISLAHELIQAGRIGRVLQVRCVYLQDWGGPDVPLFWRYQKKYAGSGALGDLAAHSIDLMRYLTGDEVKSVNGAVLSTVYKKRLLPEQTKKWGRVDVDDISLFLTTLKSGAVASFEATRLPQGYKNHNKIEIHGDKGSIRFDLERMTELDYFDSDSSTNTQGWSTINVSEGGAGHPYASDWWPAGHNLGYEHTFVNQFADMVRDMNGLPPRTPLPTFHDAYEVQRVLEAVMLANREGCTIPLSQVK
ncbi:1,5-anhydro-D-fructose reductase [Poriferisphaera corsica]|uniref:1,5-anhydro-D-fructose reductase n=1 Tax=Poriferisphaera corsica TaxID=2528020 RepID=A0A517YU94_9BACT|nr:Gfo/Idh/MocA family oxidoreductase [Poriferisphaera corsica]QDU33788.1 1,5-anhydro-D-fructose reductase [Poriferisphaera corsica]